MKNILMRLFVTCLMMAMFATDPSAIACAQGADPSADSPVRIRELHNKRRSVQQEIDRSLAADPDSEKSRKTIRDLVRQEFEILQEIQQFELNLMRRRLKQIEQKIQQQKDSANRIIDQRVDMILDGSLSDSASAANPISMPAGSPMPVYHIDPGDTLGVYIPQILGDHDAPPVFQVPGSARPPVIGYPLTVRHDGTLKLPLLDSFPVAGLTLPEAETKIAKAFVEQEILRESAFVSLALLARSGELRSGSAAQVQPAGSIPAKTAESPPERSDQQAEIRNRTEKSLAEDEIVRPGDTLGIFVAGVVGSADGPPPTFIIEGSNQAPVVGFPFKVRSDGAVSLPLVGAVDVGGQNISSAERTIKSAYVDNNILQASTVIIVQLAPRGKN